MMRSMYAGVSGVRSHQTMMDVVGNNIANVNTTGFRASRVQFADTLSQQLRGASGGSGEATAGINPQQVGLGTTIAKTQMMFGQGGSQLTGQATDVAIQGAGFFTVRLGAEQLYTRAGSFTFDQQGLLTDPSGGIVQGWNLDATTGAVNTNNPVSDISVPINQTIPPAATSTVVIGGNLSAEAVVGDQQQTAFDLVDNVGEYQRIQVTWENTGANAWSVTLNAPDGSLIGTAAVTFDPASGDLATPAAPVAFTFTPPDSDPVNFETSFGTPGSPGALTQFGGSSDAQILSQDGSAAGHLRSFAISDDGVLSGVFSNGKTSELAVLALSSFSNEAGLVSAGNSRLRASNASGQALVGTAGTGGRGELSAGQVEMSNVELAQEFTNLIVAQRGFQASSRVITTSDEMIQELVNLKR